MYTPRTDEARSAKPADRGHYCYDAGPETTYEHASQRGSQRGSRERCIDRHWQIPSGRTHLHGACSLAGEDYIDMSEHAEAEAEARRARCARHAHELAQASAQAA